MATAINPDEKIKLTFTPKLGGLKNVPEKEFAAKTAIGEVQRLLARGAPQQRGSNVMVYVFVDDSFMPTPDETVGNLAEVFGTTDKETGKKTLPICYSLQIYQG